jgi:hypothetical protein
LKQVKSVGDGIRQKEKRLDIVRLSHLVGNRHILIFSRVCRRCWNWRQQVRTRVRRD